MAWWLLDDGMSTLLSATASMNCPLCRQAVGPTADLVGERYGHEEVAVRARDAG